MRTKIDKQDARLDFQKRDMLNAYNDNLVKEEAEKEKAYQNTIFESAYTGMGSYLHNKRVKEQANERAFKYADHFTTLALTEALSECVERSLLLDTEAYAELNPNYKKEIRETVKNFLENATINENIDNKVTLALYEAIKGETPLADLYLTEEDENTIISDHIMNKDTIDRGLDQLSRDVRARVANIVTKDQKALNDEDEVLAHANEKEAEVAPLVPVETPAEDEYAPIPDPEAPVEDVPAEEVPAEQPLTENKKIKIVKEQAKTGIVETLALNEAAAMIADGKEYNKNLALANALKYITILETLDASGIVSIGNAGYNRILSASGVNMNPVARVNIPGANIVDTPVATCPECAPETKVNDSPVKIELPNEDPKDKKVGSAISDLLKDAIPAEFTIGNGDDKLFEPFKQWKQENPSFGKHLADIPTITEDLKGKYTNMKGEVFTEEALREYFENQGFDLNYVDFEDLWRSWHFKKH